MTYHYWSDSIQVVIIWTNLTNLMMSFRKLISR